ncbi:M14 family metallopeptidase [Siphonobacter sp.]|uniref:M14 family metallopeptidase n=1 Tax=Siphonobacter sp. TaxID=1869184 RepID=UPI003B3AD6EC
MNQRLILFLFLLLASSSLWAQQSYYFPNTGTFDPRIPSPEQFLGYPIGTHYTRHDQIVAYFKELERTSNGKAHVQVIGKSYEERPQIILTVTAPENYSNLEKIRQKHLTVTDPAQPNLTKADPVIVLLGYSVHGAETSGGEAALLTAYYLVANQSAETAQYLKESVILIDPAQNPDGRDRAANWHNMYKSFPPVSDPADLEHLQGFPGGRVNHYFTDLNRDWLSAEQIESKNRVDFSHQWYPNVHIDFHEMGTNSTYYFEPTPAGHQSPLLPQSSYDFNATLAKYHAEALDKIGSLYFTKESFDNLSPIYGSTYPDFYGAVGVTFEQGSSRGLVQESTSGPVTFPFTIRNHLVTGLATLKGALAEKENLFKLQKDFFKSAVTQGKANPAKAFVFGDSRDVSLTNKLLSLVLRHRLKVYTLNADVTADGKKFEKGKAYVVPAEQPFFRIVHSLFEETPKLKDSTFYDNTSWSVVHAYGIQQAKLNSVPSLGQAVTAVPTVQGGVAGGKAQLAYLLNWSEYNASRALYSLLSQGVLVKTSLKPFTSQTATGPQKFSYGSLVIPVAGQKISSDSLYRAVEEASRRSNLTFATTSTGFSLEGIDLGSNNILPVRKPEVALITGATSGLAEAGQVWFLLNEHLQLPVSKLDPQSLERVSLDRYQVLVLPNGTYREWSKPTVDALKAWVSRGGTLITFRTASEWAISQGFAKERVFVDSSATRRNASVTRVDYATRAETEAPRRINGGIFLADIDITNPIAFGLNDRKIFFTKTGNTILLPSKDKYATVAKYLPSSYISGYVSKENVAKINNTASILVGQLGHGKVILFAEDPTYRHYWHGTNRLFLNALFYGNLIQLQSAFLGAAEE